MGSLVVVEVPPFLEFFIKPLCIIYNDRLERAIELFLVAPVTLFGVPVKLPSSTFSKYVIDPPVQHLPAGLSLELSTIFGLDHFCPKRYLGQHIGNELDGRSLLGFFVHFRNSKPRAIVDGRILIKPFAGQLIKKAASRMDQDPGFRLKKHIDYIGLGHYCELGHATAAPFTAEVEA